MGIQAGVGGTRCPCAGQARPPVKQSDMYLGGYSFWFDSFPSASHSSRIVCKPCRVVRFPRPNSLFPSSWPASSISFPTITLSFVSTASDIVFCLDWSGVGGSGALTEKKEIYFFLDLLGLVKQCLDAFLPHTYSDRTTRISLKLDYFANPRLIHGVQMPGCLRPSTKVSTVEQLTSS